MNIDSFTLSEFYKDCANEEDFMRRMRLINLLIYFTMRGVTYFRIVGGER